MVAGNGRIVSNVNGRYACAGKKRIVNDVPGEPGAVVVGRPVVREICLLEQFRLAFGNRGELPGNGSAQVNGRLAALKVVEVGSGLSVDADDARRSGYELRDFARKKHTGRRLGGDKGQLIKGARQARKGLLVLRVHAPNRIAHGFVAGRYFLGEGTLAQLQNGAANRPVGPELVAYRGAREGLCLKIKQGVILKTYPNRNSALQNGFVDNTHLTKGVVHGKVLVLGKHVPPGRHRNGSARNIKGIQLNDGSARRLIATAKQKLILLGLLLGAEQGRIVELLVDVPLALFGRTKLLRKGGAKGFQGRQENSARGRQDGQSFHKVKESVWEGIAVGIDFIGLQDLHQQLILNA